MESFPGELDTLRADNARLRHSPVPAMSTNTSR